jgi:hypothetical protein
MGRPMERMRPAPVTTATLPSRPVNISPLIPGVWRTLAAFVGSILGAVTESQLHRLRADTMKR